MTRKRWTVAELNEAVRSGRLSKRQLDALDINGLVVDPHTGTATLEQSPNDIGMRSSEVGVDQFGLDKVQKRTPQQRVASLMEKVGRGIMEAGAGTLPDKVIEDIRLEYKWQEGKDIPAEMVRAILAKYLHVETEKAEEGYNKTVTYSRPSYQ